jgi:quinol monooxygenase YgiN
MFVVTVKFNIRKDNFLQFMESMQKQARDSLLLEENCHHFDISKTEMQPNQVFLYEIYESQSDFKIHLDSAHFKQFDAKVASWVETKLVETYQLVT